MEVAERKYTIGDKIFVQRPLVLGQVKQLVDLLKDTNIPINAGGFELIGAMGESLPVALAIVLTEEGLSPKDKDIFDLAFKLEFAVTPDMALDVIDFFFALNPIASLLSRVGEMMGKVMTSMPGGETSLQNSASSLVVDELTKETGSSGT